MGGVTYNLMRAQKNPDGSMTVYTFKTDSEGVAKAWLNFWNTAGWTTTVFLTDKKAPAPTTPPIYNA